MDSDASFRGIAHTSQDDVANLKLKVIQDGLGVLIQHEREGFQAAVLLDPPEARRLRDFLNEAFPGVLQ